MNNFIIVMNFAAFLISLTFTSALLLKRKKWGRNSIEGIIQYKSLNNIILFNILLIYTAPYIFVSLRSKTINLEAASVFIFAAAVIIQMLISRRLLLINQKGLFFDYKILNWKNIKNFQWTDNQLKIIEETDWNETSYNLSMSYAQKLSMIKLLNQYIN